MDSKSRKVKVRKKHAVKVNALPSKHQVNLHALLQAHKHGGKEAMGKLFDALFEK